MIISGMHNKRDYISRLEDAEDFDSIFQIVKDSVYETMGIRRAGLGLILMDIHPAILGLYGVASNYIILNKRIFTYAKIRLDKISFNSLVYIVLLHEYLHSLGYLDEDMVRRYVKEISINTFGEDHMVSKFAEKPVDLDMLKESLNLEIDPNPDMIKRFDSDSTKYIG